MLYVLSICKRHSTSMILNDTQSQIRTLDFAVLLIVFIVYIGVEEIIIFFNLSSIIINICFKTYIYNI